jgi:hypothetical protein
MQDKGQPIHLDSHYLSAGIFAAGHTARQIRLTLAGWDGGTGQLGLDPNTCTLDAFGDPAGCTRMAIRTTNVKITPMQADGPRRLFAIQGEGLTRPSFRLVLIGDGPRPEAARLLVLGEEDKITALVPLRIAAEQPAAV